MPNIICDKHGPTDHYLEKRGCYRCKKCRVEYVTASRKRQKTKLIGCFGGKCEVCGYCKCQDALQFHHVNPGEKNFGLAHKGMTRSFKRALAEAKKCVLLCAICHAEVEAGLLTIPTSILKRHDKSGMATPCQPS